MTADLYPFKWLYKRWTCKHNEVWERDLFDESHCCNRTYKMRCTICGYTDIV